MHVFGRALCALVLSILVVFAIAGCGGGDDNNENKIGPASKVTLSTTAISLDLGQVFTGLSAVVQDANNNQVCTTGGTVACAVTYSATPSGIIDIANNGWICAGVWDSKTTPVVCNALPPAQGVGQVNLVGTYQNINSPATVVNTHVRVSRITLTPATAGCTSSGQTQQLTARAFDAANIDITANVGTFNYQISDSSVGTMSTTGLVTAVRPGAATAIATIGAVSSLPYSFETCAPASISLFVNGTPSQTDATLAVGGTTTLAFTAVDSRGAIIPPANLNLLFSTSAPNVVSTVSSTGVTTGSRPGNAVIVASCTPPTCNNGVGQSVYSNPFNVTVTGTSSTTVYATGTQATTIVPISTDTNTAGTAITIPTITPTGGTATQPTINSMIAAPSGDRIYIGTNLGLLTLTTASNVLGSPNQNVPGQIMAISPDGGTLLVRDANNTHVYAFNSSTLGVATLVIPNSLAAAWSADGLKAFITTAGTGVYVFSPSLTHRVINTPDAGFAIAGAPQGTLVYREGTSNLQVIAVCNNNVVATVPLNSSPALIGFAANGARMFTADQDRIHRVGVSIRSQPCPPTTFTHTPTAHSLSGPITPRQLIVLSDATKAYVTHTGGGLKAFDANTGVVSDIFLSGGGGSATTGGATSDAKAVYVGNRSGLLDVQRIDTSNNTVTHSIAVNLKKADNTPVPPDFVVVKP